ncbi:MAG: 50S ribosomal protein L23 [Elusimicrobia bacterium]|nr:50S ribosomal protein L23 [Elusimicrobiota bacterium]
MSEKEIYGTIVRPLLTERSTIMKEKHNQYVFETDPSATKPDIARAVEELFKVKVVSVRTMILPGKFRRYGRGGGYRPDWKKAVVTLKEGQKIDFAEQAS